MYTEQTIILKLLYSVILYKLYELKTIQLVEKYCILLWRLHWDKY